MLIGEAPGAEEDRQGKPFVGAERPAARPMLATIGLDRTSVYITNMLYWRPPGNRSADAGRDRRLPALPGAPDRAAAARADGVRRRHRGARAARRQRGHDQAARPALSLPAADGPIPAMVMFHPAYLLRQPAQKRLAWRDLLGHSASTG